MLPGGEGPLKKSLVDHQLNRAGATHAPNDAANLSEPKALLVNVAFTTPKGTLAAIREASRLTKDLHGSIRVILPLVVPYPLDLSHPQVNPEFAARPFRHLYTATEASLQFEIVRCREAAHAYTLTLAPNSTVVLGGPRRWWPTRETRLARSLTCKGHNVLFVSLEKH